MFVGHEFLAFALAAGATRLVVDDSRTALLAGGVAALCALLPDLDVAYGLVTYAVAVGEGTPLSWDAFWGVTNGVHRVVTHPLPVGAAATLTFAAAVALARAVAPNGAGRRTGPANRASAGYPSRRATEESRTPLAGGATVAGAVTVAVAALAVSAVVVSALGRVAGESATVVAVAYLGTVCAVGVAVGRRTDAGVGVLAVAAGVGFLTHPFGDVLMAAPPPLFAPFAPSPLTDRLVFAGDGTVNLLAILFVEVATVWAGLLIFLRLTGRRVREAVARRAVVGVGYAAAAVVLPRPTMADAHLLGFTIVPVAAVAGATAGLREGSRLDRAIRGVATGLATLTVAAASYLLVYGLL